MNSSSVEHCPPVPYFHVDGARIVCEICPVHCKLSEGQVGICRGRGVVDGELVALNYGRVVSFNHDPIEKKPLYHFLPGANIASVGPNGCNLRCKWCQNCEISQFDAPTRYIPPEILAERAMEHRSVGLAYTYAEPMIWFETIRDTAPLVRKAGGVNVLVTNGYVDENPLEELLPLIDAANVDLKFADPRLYKTGSGARLDVVQRTIKRMVEAGVHVEITHLLVTGMSDNEQGVHQIAEWVASLDENIPLHLSRYFPRHLVSEPPTLLEFMERAWDVARTSLRYVYLGNISTRRGADTLCPSCGATAVRRSGWAVDASGVRGDGSCASCGTPLSIHLVKP
ncbi:MAG: AmmeMemoRadiSam system radical SAM enzyme [bacterium]